MIIKVKKENREKFIKEFEAKGFKIDGFFSKKAIIESQLPITLDFKAKTIGRMGNVTCAAAAASQGLVVQEEDFWKMDIINI